MYVNGSKLLVTQGDSYGWYDLGLKEYQKLITNSNYYYVVILDRPELTFILPPSKVKEIFGEVNAGDDNEWHYKLRKKNGHYILRPSNDHRDTGTIHYVEEFLNTWTQIEDFRKTHGQTDIEMQNPTQTKNNDRLDQSIETDSLCEQISKYIEQVEYLQELDKNTIERWTNALKPLRAKAYYDSYEQWKMNLDIETLTELYEFINDKEEELENTMMPDEVISVHNLSRSSSIIMCGIRQLQNKFGFRANMNAHKYTVLKEQFPNIVSIHSNGYWIFVATDHNDEHVTAQQILYTRMKDQFWGLNAKTPFRTSVKKGDKVIFSYGARKFIGSATSDSDSFELTEEQKNYLSHGQHFFRTDFGVNLKDMVIWEEQKPVEQYVDKLSFIKKKENYSSYFQGGIKKISAEEYNTIIGNNDISEPKSDLLSFTDLQRFLLQEMRMRANYQPIMIRALLESGGKATINQITSKIQELNPDKTDADLKNIPVYDVLENRGIVRKKNNNQFILNSEDLNENQCQQLIALCNWKIHNMSLQLEELIRAFDKNRNLFDINRSPEELEMIRSSFVSSFPLEKILQLQLDEYVIGKRDPKTGTADKSTFCYRLENEMKKLSSFPVRSSFDFGVYYSRKKEGYDYKNKEKYSSPQEAFDAIRSEIFSILKAGEQYHINHDLNTLLSILELKYNIRRPIISKILSIYYPEDFVQIHVLNVLEIILQAFRTSIDNFNGRFFMAQAHLLEIKRLHPIMRQWSTSDFSHFLWRTIIKRDESTSEPEDEDDNMRIQIKEEPIVFVTAYDNSNLNRSKELGILGWKSNSKLLSPGDYIFVFNKSTLDIDSCFKVTSKSDNTDMIWSNELESNQLIYKNRWNAELISGNLRIPLEDINNMPPFNKESFQLRLKGNFPMPLNSPGLDNKYEDFCNFLLNKINQPFPEMSDKSVERTKSQLKDWHLLTVEDIDQIIQNVLQGDKGEKKRTLAIPRETVRRIIIHLISSKHVILAGPPGTGKTDLARRLLREPSERIIGSSYPIEAVASYEWGRYEVIGGNSLKTNLEGDDYVFHFGCVTKAIKEQKLLLIDEFNRADMNKAFGEMFLAMDHEIIQLREDENPDIDLLLYDKLKNSVTIPKKFRMICTMNDYDKSRLNDLSYGLLRRFAFVEIDAPSNKHEEMNVVIERMKINNNHADSNELITDEVIRITSVHIDKFLDFMHGIRNRRKLGVSTSINVAKYIAAGYSLTNKTDLGKDGNNNNNNNGILWKLLDEALVDHILPQLDRLDLGTLVYVKEVAYNTLLDHNGNIPNIIRTGFILKLENVISSLDYINRLFATPKNDGV